MQLTGGQYKGRKITTPPGVRPTLSIVRESVFNILFSTIGSFKNRTFLDLFLGSGIMTFEAISRGFCTTSCDINLKVIKNAQQNANKLGLSPRIILSDSFKCLKKIDTKFDVIYADPPWNLPYTQIFENACLLLKKDAILVVECDIRKKPNILLELGSISTLELFREKNYGRCCLLFIKLNG